MICTSPASSRATSPTRHIRVRAKPCAGLVGSLGWAANHGKQTGTPPRIAVPAPNTARGLRNSTEDACPVGVHSQRCAPYGVSRA